MAPRRALPQPRLTDDGRAVALDLHGARVDEALALAGRAVALAAARGRATLRLVHGTSPPPEGGRTIRQALHEWLDGGAAGPLVASAYRQEGALLLGLAAAPRADARRLTLADLRSG